MENEALCMCVSDNRHYLHTFSSQYYMNWEYQMCKSHKILTFALVRCYAYGLHLQF